MDINIYIFLLAIALAMDSFAVSLSLGLAGSAKTTFQKLTVGFSFGLVEGFVFGVGVFLVSILPPTEGKVRAVLSFGILLFLGIKMIREGLESSDGDLFTNLGVKKTIFFAFATSLDAFAAGLSFGLLAQSASVNLVADISIAVAAISFSLVGVFFGAKLAKVIGSKANFFGGGVLIFLGVLALLG